MNKQETLQVIANNVRKKHPWKISQEKYQKLFGDLPQDFLNERLAYDNLLEKMKQFKLCHLCLSEVKIEINLTLDECIIWELNLDKYEDVSKHNITLGDIKKIIKEQ
tara:strand:- start:5495 stop:5815 length:321 start_codon:yes stop_codon:yes gene_type:complete